jgi:hypothetical protein
MELLIRKLRWLNQQQFWNNTQGILFLVGQGCFFSNNNCRRLYCRWLFLCILQDKNQRKL